MEEMIEELKEAIHNRVYVQFLYNGMQRDVEPHTLGESTTGKIILNAYQIHGDTSQESGRLEWRSFDVSNIENLHVRDMDIFLSIRSGYNPDNDNIVEPYASIEHD